MALIRNDVGDVMIVWSKNKGRPSSSRLVITSHGGEIKINGMDQPGVPRDCKLVFYGPHGYMVSDPNLAALIAGNLVVHETLSSPKLSQDYQLTKYTNTDKKSTQHNAVGETYNSTETMPDMFPLFASMAQKGGDNIYAANYGKSFDMDILTIRNRRWHKDPTFSKVLKELWSKKYCYEEVHCAFCRGDRDSDGRGGGFRVAPIPGRS